MKILLGVPSGRTFADFLLTITFATEITVFYTKEKD